ncbi:MAG TPA: hypothetical protein VIF83_09625 [Gemmatimonadaceae bacterium]|jgi:hypothetical protein
MKLASSLASEQQRLSGNSPDSRCVYFKPYLTVKSLVPTDTPFRRTAARDFRRAGVSEAEIMRLCGWKTRDMFDRYNIIDSADLSRAVAQRFNGKQAANNSVEVTGVSQLSR